MSNNSPASGFGNYVVECVRLLYWAYFKPFTFKVWLRDIHPELKLTDDPFAKQAEFRNNPRLRRYAWQVLWLTAIVPILAILLVASVYTLASGKLFNWFFSCVFCVGWFIGRLLDRDGNNKRLVILLIASFSIVLAVRFISPVALSMAIGVALGVAFGLVLGVAVGVTVGVLVGLACGLALGAGWGVDWGLAFGVAGGVAVGPAFGLLGVGGTVGGVVVGVVFGLVYSPVWGLAWGVAFGVAFILGVLRVYFWLPEFLWTLLLFLCSRNGGQVNCLKYLPPRFDELIILPLPFLDLMIVEAHRNNPAATRETINYLINFTNQQKVAARAISGVAVDILNRCRRLEDIVDITNQLAWVTSPASKELGAVLPQFLDISQDVKASQEATSPYLQYELLDRPINALRQLEQSLAFTDVRTATSFGNAAQRWLKILETAQRTLEQQAQQSKEIRQVYIAGNGLDPQTAKNRFKGRIDIFREIETLTLSEQPPVLLLYGGRRTGKTSALKYLPYRIGANIIPLLVDVQGAASATTLKGFAENIAEQIIEVARQLPRKLDLPRPNADKLAEDPFPALQTWLAEIERSHPDKKFLLCLDEFERLSEVVEATNSRAPLNFIRHVLQHQRRWILLFSGSHQLSELDSYWSDYLINTRALRMSYLQESEARELITQPVEDFVNIYEPTAVKEIIQITRCQPYLVQLVCFEVVELLNRDIRRNGRSANTAKASAQDIQEIIPTVLERGDPYFQELWDSLEHGDRNLLLRLITGEFPTQQDKRIVRKLARKEILTPEGNEFQVFLVRKFVEQMKDEE